MVAFDCGLSGPCCRNWFYCFTTLALVSERFFHYVLVSYVWCYDCCHCQQIVSRRTPANRQKKRLRPARTTPPAPAPMRAAPTTTKAATTTTATTATTAATTTTTSTAVAITATAEATATAAVASLWLRPPRLSSLDDAVVLGQAYWSFLLLLSLVMALVVVEMLMVLSLLLLLSLLFWWCCCSWAGLPVIVDSCRCFCCCCCCC